MKLKELSSHLGLSPTTVSRALNGYPEVNKATRERVVAAAKKLNYRPNARAIQLATGRAMAVGTLFPVSTRNDIVNPIFADFIAGAGEVYSRNDYDMVLSIVPDDTEEQNYRSLKSKGTVDGVIVHGPRNNDPRIAFLTEIGLPFVVHGRSEGANADYSWLDVNNLRAFQRATDFLLDLGHTRISLVNGLESLNFAIRRREGYCTALAMRGIGADLALMASEEMTEFSGFRAGNRMLDLSVPPTAFLASSMLSGMGLRRAIEGRGLRLGRDVSLIIFDDDLSYLRNGEDVPIFTSTRSSVREAGRQAAQMLLDMIADPAMPPQHRLLEAELIIGQSTGPAPAKS